MRIGLVPVLTLILVALACATAAPEGAQVGNLGYNSYEGYLSKGAGLEKRFGPGVGYPAESADLYHRYLPEGQWGRFGYGTGHLGEGYGPYVFPRPNGTTPPGMFDPLPEAYKDAPPPSIKVSRGTIRVGMRGDIPGIRCVTVTLVAFNNADLACQTLDKPPYAFVFPVPDGVKNVRVRIDYDNNGLSATSYSL